MTKFRLVAIAFFSVILSSTGFANESPEYKAINKTLNNYFVGYDTGNISLLKNAFHPDVQIKYLDLRSKKYATLSMPELFDFMQNLPKGWKSNAEVHSIDVHGSAAQAKVSVSIHGGKLVWTDYIGLLKINNNWTIVSKISHGDLMRGKKKSQ